MKRAEDEFAKENLKVIWMGFQDKKDKIIDVTMAQQAIRKPLETEDIIGAVLFLSSDLSKLTTGQTLMVDGGTVML